MKSDLKDCFERGSRYLIYLIGGGGLSTLISIFAVVPIRMLTGHIWELVWTTVLETVIMMSVVFYKGYKVGYKEGKCKAVIVIVSMIIASVFHLIYSAVFGFSMWTAPPAFYLGFLIYCLKNGVREIVMFPDIYTFSTLWIFNALYVFAAYWGERTGAKRRKLERDNLIKKQ